MQVRSCAVDPAHTLDKGCVESTLGSVFKNLVYEKTLATRGTLGDNVVMLNTTLAEWYKQQPQKTQVGRILLKDFVDPWAPHKDYPEYNSGSMSKNRSLVGFATHLCRCFHSGSDRDQQRLLCCENLERILHIIYTGSDFLPPHEVSRLRTSVDAYLWHQTYLRWEAEQRAALEYGITYKHHYLWHVAQEAEFINPRVGGVVWQMRISWGGSRG